MSVCRRDAINRVSTGVGKLIVEALLLPLTKPNVSQVLPFNRSTWKPLLFTSLAVVQVSWLPPSVFLPVKVTNSTERTVGLFLK